MLDAWTRLRHLGWQRRCDCCRARLRRFVKYRGRPDAQCPVCGALERHRTLARWARASLPAGAAVLHFAPEPCMVDLLRGPSRDYVAADLHPEAGNVAPGVRVVEADITALPFAGERFDYVFLSHVLEHVTDDERALRELWRVLRPGGVLVAQHPWDPALGQTRHDPAVTSPQERQRLYGQVDHVRVYGADRLDVFERVGFEVTERFVADGPGQSIDEAHKPG